jgi:hypothetical protein
MQPVCILYPVAISSFAFTFFLNEIVSLLRTTLHQNISTNSPNNGLFRRLFRESSKLVFISHYLRDYLETGYYTRLFGDFLQITC